MPDFNDPERGGKPGVYVIENAEGQERELVAQNHPQADAFIRMNATYKMSLQEWNKKQLEKRTVSSEPKVNKQKKGDK